MPKRICLSFLPLRVTLHYSVFGSFPISSLLITEHFQFKKENKRNDSKDLSNSKKMSD